MLNRSVQRARDRSSGLPLAALPFVRERTHHFHSLGAHTLEAVAKIMMLLLASGALLLSTVAEGAMAPANAVIGNQASATYVDSTGVSRPAVSNTVVTTVSQVKSFTLGTNGSRSAPANTVVCYPHTISNTGNGADTYALNAPVAGGMFAHTAMAYYPDSDQNGQPDSAVPITTTGPLAANSSFGFVVCGTTALTATLGQQGTITVTVSDTNSPAPNSVSNIDTTSIQPASVTVSKKLSSVPPPGYSPVLTGPSPNAGPIFVILEYVNSGSIQADGLTLQDVLPAGMLYVPGTGRWSGSGVAALTDLPGGDPAGIAYQAPVSATSGTISATINSLAASAGGSLYFQITIAPSLAPAPSSLPATTNTAQYRYSYQFSGSTYCVNGATTTVIMMANAGASCPAVGADTNSVSYSVLQTAGVVANGSPTTTGIADSEPVSLASAAVGQVVTWTDYIWNTGNGPDTFDISLNSTALNGAGCSPANNAAAGQCTFPANTTFRLLAAGGATTLLDTNGNSIGDTSVIPLPAAGVCPAPFATSTSVPVRCGYPLVVSATIPAAAVVGNNGGNGFQVSVVATSTANSGASESVPNRLSAIAASTVDLTNNVSVTGGATLAQGLGPDDSAVKIINSVTPANAAPTVTRFRLFANNTSPLPQIYDLSFNWVSVPGGAGLINPPIGWTVVFKADGGVGDCSTTVGAALLTTGAVPVPAGGSRLVCAEVSIPPTSNGAAPSTPTYSPPGNYDIQFGIAQQNDPSVADRIRDRVTVLPLRALSITPNGAQSTVPSGVTTYSHVVMNGGNSGETVTFVPGAYLTNSQVPAFGWAASAYLDSNANGVLDLMTDTLIVPGTTTFPIAANSTQLVFVRVVAPPTLGSPPNITTVTATYNGGISTASATDTTTLNDGLKLDKYQQLPGGTGSCSIVPPAILAAGVPAAPWSSAAVGASANTSPGRCVSYLIVGTNNSPVNVSNISLSDVTPPNTKLETGCGAPTVTGPIAITGGPYATGFTGSIAAQSAPLASTPLPPAGNFTLQFCVKINDM